MISIHAPHTGRDLFGMLPILIIRNFNPRAPYGARPRKQRLINAFTNFNPRAPYGARPQELFGICLQTNFNPRAPYGARLDPKYIKDMYHAISIHAPHTGRDFGEDISGIIGFNFNPRAPYGARRAIPPMIAQSRPFQSTRPIRGATRRKNIKRRGPQISIHAPHTGRDPTTTREIPRTSGFQSTRPIRGATSLSGWDFIRHRNFNPRAPYGARPREPPLIL